MPETNSPQSPLEVSQPLTTFSDFIRAVPERWRSASVYIQDSDQFRQAKRACTLSLERDKNGNRIIIISAHYTPLKP